MDFRWMTLAAIALVAAQANAAEPQDLRSDRQKMSYALGTEAGRNVRRLGLDLDIDAVAQGMKDALSGAKPLMSEDEIEEMRRRYRAEMRKNRDEARQRAAQENAERGAAFLAENKAKPGVVTLPSGLQYRILVAGNGRKPTDQDTVECHYRGTLIDGKEFDSSYRRGAPATFALARVIPGWREALQLMPVGSKWQLVIPPQLAYGARGAGREIGPHATLVFEVELLAIK